MDQEDHNIFNYSNEKTCCAPSSSTEHHIAGSPPRVSLRLLLTSPSTVSFQASAFVAASGIWPLLRMKNLAVGVVSSSRS
jgi:hypothetical protein